MPRIAELRVVRTASPRSLARRVAYWQGLFLLAALERGHPFLPPPALPGYYGAQDILAGFRYGPHGPAAVDALWSRGPNRGASLALPMDHRTSVRNFAMDPGVAHFHRAGVAPRWPRQPDDHHFWSLIMLAVTAGSFLLITWVATKALFLLLQESPVPEDRLAKAMRGIDEDFRVRPPNLAARQRLLRSTMCSLPMVRVPAMSACLTPAKRRIGSPRNIMWWLLWCRK
jgi:hypothetical protein